ncbi:hypothetical protein Desti_5042 [Desulfomonile tiedjei DSM 6799]|uniref:Uncharacterized protein n=2 Tax=Desulfomonile tiedjei TaxID=2358 RepID=I4CDL1_DESTA|nr:hypothetical protein Desti_5042 [Desulfomonile tiedjei DSM 6799]
MLQQLCAYKDGTPDREEKSTAGPGEFYMFWKYVRLGIICAVLAGIASCAGPKPQTRTPEESSRIKEEDLTTPRTQPEQYPADPSQVTPVPQGGSPPAIDPGSRQPRKFIFRDRKGG